jgi:membrane protease YdiL (CAAX protease family)
VVPYLGLAAFALKKMWDDGTLVDKLKPRSGDLALGAVTGLILVGASWAARTLLTPSTPRQAWFYRLYMQLGDPEQLQRSLLYTLLILLSALCEEIVWRGMVLSELKERFGARRGWPLTTLCYALATLPTAFVLADPTAGPNPLLVVAALGCGMVWGFVASQTGRIVPSAISHMVFTYFSIVQFRWPGM